MKSAIGVDGCRSGWIAARLSSDDRVEVSVLRGIDAVWSWRGGDGVILIDVPIGLWDRGLKPRRCDAAARRALGAPRASSVFPPPCRPALAAASWEEASAINERLTGKRLPRQAWAIAGKIREVDEFLRQDPRRQAFLREVHPEILFWALNGGQSMRHNKTRPEGRRERLDVLTRHWPDAARTFERERDKLRANGAEVDDLLDAMAAAVSWRACEGRFATLPEIPEVDEAGLRMEMLFPPIRGSATLW